MASRAYSLQAPTGKEVVDGKRFLSLAWTGWVSALGRFIGAVTIIDAAYDPPNLASGASVSFNVSTPGVNGGDFAQASFTPGTAGMVWLANVTANDVTTVTLRNETAGAVNMPAGTLRIRTEAVV